MDKNLAIQYFKEHKEEIFDLCKELDLKFSYENREGMLASYNFLKERQKRLAERFGEDDNRVFDIDRLIKGMEKEYHIFDAEFDEKLETMWLPKEYNTNTHEIFEFRKSMYNTQSIYHDFKLDSIIKEDMGFIWDEKEGQDGMYDAFPFTFSRKSIIGENDYTNEYLETDVHYTTELIRSYALDSCGGIVIIEEREYSHFKDETKVRKGAQDSYSSRQWIISLGEDDGYHFLNGRFIYECNYGTNKEFLDLVNKAIEEYKNFTSKNE